MKSEILRKLAASLVLALSLMAVAGALARPALAVPPISVAEEGVVPHNFGSCGGYQEGFQKGYADGLQAGAFGFNNKAVLWANQGCGREFLTGYMAGNNQGSLQTQMGLTPGFQNALPPGFGNILLPMPQVLDYNQGWGAFGSTLGSGQNWNWHDTGNPPAGNYGSGGYDPYYGPYDVYTPSGGFFGDGYGSGGYSPSFGPYDYYTPSGGYFYGSPY